MKNQKIKINRRREGVEKIKKRKEKGKEKRKINQNRSIVGAKKRRTE